MPRAGAAPLNSAGADIAGSFPGIRSSISKTPQSLLLTGTLVGRTASDGRAFIGIDARNPQTYVVGALMANGARLVGIYKDHVIIEKDGQSARLDTQGRGAFHWFGDDSSALTVVTAASGPASNPVVSAELFTDYIRPNPVYDGELLTGYQLYPGRRSGVFYQFGLQPGDVVTSLDGQPLSEPTQAVELFRQLASGTVMTATITRKSQSLELTLDGGSIVAAQAVAVGQP